MLPSAGYFKTILCPFFEDNHECPRTFCHYRHLKREKSTVDKNKTKNTTASSNGFSYRPTPLSLLGQDKGGIAEEPPAYNPTPITPTKIKEEPNPFHNNDEIDQLWQEIQAPSKADKKDSAAGGEKKSKSSQESRSKKSSSSKDHHKSSKDRNRKEENKSDSSEKKHHKNHHRSRSSSDSSKKDYNKTSEKHNKDSKHSKESHHSKSRSKDHDKSSKDRRRSSDESGSGSRKSHDHHKRKKSSTPADEDTTSTKKSKSENEEKDVANSVLSFLDAMDAIDKKLEKNPKDYSSADEKKPTVIKKPPKIIQESSPSFLAAISKPDKLLKKNLEIDPRKSRIRVSSVKPSDADAGMSSTMIARKKQPNNPVQAMLSRFNKVRVESQTKDLEEQLSALTGEDLEPSTSSSAKAKRMEPLEGLRKGKSSYILTFSKWKNSIFAIFKTGNFHL